MPIDRRRLLRTGAGLAMASLAPACGGRAPSAPLHGYSMPLESEPHERTLMQWPVSLAVYHDDELRRIQAAIALVANTIAEFEPVAMLVASEQAATARRHLSASVELWDIPTDDLWCRDSGPTFVRDASGKLAVAHLRFNGWGNKQPHRNDALIAPRVAERLGLPLLDTGLVGEQGGVEHDGAGTLLAHASCWANPNRNTLSQQAIGERLIAALGGRTMIWAPGIAGKDITDFHIDALARFVGPGKVLIQLGERIDPADPWSVAGHETLRVLDAAQDASGRKLELVRLPDPVQIRSGRADFVASYVNYYLCNGAVIAAEFGDPAADRRARETLQELYPGRSVVMLNVDPIGEAGGGIHCATQQQPKGNAP